MKNNNILAQPEELNINSLNLAIKSYLKNYCFSTIDILLTNRKILSLEIEDLYNKIIENKRGGYCFEHNKLFNYFLEDRGLKVVKQLARVVYGKDIDAPKTHRINIVTVEGDDYLVDVGFGAHTPNSLIPMDGEEIKCPNGSSYKVTECKDGVFSLSVLREEGFFTFYTFDMGLYTEVDFNLSSYFSNTHPQSKHAHNLVMSINENKVTKAILNRMKMTIVNGIKAKEEVIKSAGDLKLTLDSDYAIKVSDKEAAFLYDTFI